MLVTQETTLLEQCCLEASDFLALEIRERSSSKWFLRIQCSPDARPFFKGSVLGKGAVLQVTAVTAVARSFLSCSREIPVISPTKSEVEALRHQAVALKLQLDRAAPSWLIPEARSRYFQAPLAKLAEAPSTVSPRGAGRLPNLPRRHFVLHLAESLYELVEQFPVRFIAGVAALAWEETDERQIRDILFCSERERIKNRVQLKRKAEASAGVDAHLLLSRVSVKKNNVAGRSAVKADAERVLEMLELAKEMTDPTTASILVSVLESAAFELGIQQNTQEKKSEEI